MDIIAFSPTGSTEKVARLVASGLESVFGPIGRTIDLTQAKGLSDAVLTCDDACVIAVPVFGGRVPLLAAENLRAICGNGARAVLVAVFGNRAFEDALVELGDIARECGFVPMAGIAAVAEHSIMRAFGAGRPDAEDARELAAFASRIASAVAQGACGADLALPGNRPYKPYAVIPMIPSAGESCTGCGLCARRCPAGAIPASDPSAADAQTCIGCMRCVSICPVHARAVPADVLAGVESKMAKACAGRKENALFM